MLKSEVITDLVKRAYKLGFDIGFYGHCLPAGGLDFINHRLRLCGRCEVGSGGEVDRLER